MADPSAHCTSTPGRALCVVAAWSQSWAPASLHWTASFTHSTLCVPSACGSSAKASSRSRAGSLTAQLAITNSLSETYSASHTHTYIMQRQQILHQCQIFPISCMINEDSTHSLTEVLPFEGMSETHIINIIRTM